MREIDKLKLQLCECTKRFDIVGAKKIRDKIVLLEFNQAEENEKATQRLRDNGSLRQLQILHSESYLLFTIASSKMEEANDLMEKEHIELLEINKAYKDYEKAMGRYCKIISSAINGDEKRHFFEDYDKLTEKIKVVVSKFFENPKNIKP